MDFLIEYILDKNSSGVYYLSDAGFVRLVVFIIVFLGISLWISNIIKNIKL